MTSCKQKVHHFVWPFLDEMVNNILQIQIVKWETNHPVWFSTILKISTFLFVISVKFLNLFLIELVLR